MLVREASKVAPASLVQKHKKGATRPKSKRISQLAGSKVQIMPQFRYKGIAVFVFLWYNKHKEIKRRLSDEKNQYSICEYIVAKSVQRMPI